MFFSFSQEFLQEQSAQGRKYASLLPRLLSALPDRGAGQDKGLCSVAGAKGVCSRLSFEHLFIVVSLHKKLSVENLEIKKHKGNKSPTTQR